MLLVSWFILSLVLVMGASRYAAAQWPDLFPNGVAAYAMPLLGITKLQTCPVAPGDGRAGRFRRTLRCPLEANRRSLRYLPACTPLPVKRTG